jgi:Kelch motif
MMRRVGTAVLLLQVAISPATLRPERMPDAVRPHELHGAVATPRGIVVAGGLAPGSAEHLDVNTRTWSPMPSPRVSRAFAGMALFEAQPTIAGGTDGRTDAFAEVESLDATLQAWVPRPSLQQGRNRLAMVAVGTSLFALGGMRGAENQRTVEELARGASSWRPHAMMPTARHGHAAVTVGRTILVIGGYGPRPLDTVEEYDVDRREWRSRSPMPTARGFLAAVVHDGAVFAIGGRIAGKAIVERYDPKSDRWARVGVFPFGRQRFAAVSDGEWIWIVGGEDSPRELWRWKP